ncbi:MAG: NUDIX hydrolase [Candidatus Shapirobacteria bacterium GW2011_GWE1_38_10]|uniref:NUDIX hydrolase n=1 Tax=Candidatus Shapirobacteria bacterium GW2011_GWE1_38_10 TaxID=1618488 RepID=A0A0G0I520_9BACT|nr:MAG: NUDIX hydrolase [Candidatus Shapirobacteria bacterium GW2011_GWF2_37_20]KKQ49622.1 MAG: NUDIX hydrolase [Candidatus Shapirobacteria bacterium GW2011_GWE1_38_10]KKQ64600.1 MAG: NUDIX hydrolase [Candidatus Shapirobacteria bacterium GW2011_GWF1_38_23]
MKKLLAKIYKALHLPKNIQLFLMRFFQDQFLVGTTGIIFNDKNEILLFKHNYRSHAWSLPGGYLKAGEHPREGLEREIKEESGLVVSVDDALKTRTDREGARIDMCYTGVFIGGEFTPTHEVSEYGFFNQENLPLLRKNQVFLIDEAIKQRIEN